MQKLRVGDTVEVISGVEDDRAFFGGVGVPQVPEDDPGGDSPRRRGERALLQEVRGGD